jgi:hypothetical protein
MASASVKHFESGRVSRCSASEAPRCPWCLSAITAAVVGVVLNLAVCSAAGILLYLLDAIA